MIDLTRPLTHSMAVYQEGLYSDPPCQISPWCDIAAQGFNVSKLELGTQTGTHIDAPRHFDAEGDTLDKLSIQSLIGSYILVDIDQQGVHITTPQDIPAFLFLRFSVGAVLSSEDFTEFLADSPPVWILSGTPCVASHSLLAFYRALARIGKYWVEDLNENVIIPSSGTIIVAPLNLQGVSGSPCRVFII